mmetsp:Transcript_28505/g.72121  ORF Transcript_28505/g.72121 Transcript_28505/m.72121 type:complete len:205 (+) Transcript_28505:194-808(+)
MPVHVLRGEGGEPGYAHGGQGPARLVRGGDPQHPHGDGAQEGLPSGDRRDLAARTRCAAHPGCCLEGDPGARASEDDAARGPGVCHHEGGQQHRSEDGRDQGLEYQCTTAAALPEGGEQPRPARLRAQVVPEPRAAEAPGPCRCVPSGQEPAELAARVLEPRSLDCTDKHTKHTGYAEDVHGRACGHEIISLARGAGNRRASAE